MGIDGSALFVAILLVAAPSFGLLTYGLARWKGRGGARWFWLGFFTYSLGLLIVAFLRRHPSPPD
jgi:hypothetical protein